MKWTTDKPTKEGDYFFKGDIVTIKENLKLHTFSKKIIVEVDNEGDRNLYKIRGSSIYAINLDNFSGLWSDQPIPEPEEEE